MSSDRTYGLPIPDDKLPAMLNALVNLWWQKWKRQKLDEDAFMIAWSELDQVVEQGKEYPLVKNLGISFLYELSARLNGGYTETEAKKLMSLMAKYE